MDITFDREKFKDAMHYVIANAGSHPGFGATKLYKILWFAECRMFTLYAKPIFNAEFIRQKHGPIPKLAMPLRDELSSDGRVRIWEDEFHSKRIWRFRSLKPPSIGRFSKEEMNTLNYWIRHIDEDHTAESISEESHDYGWEIAKMGEVLPVYACLASRIRDPNPNELQHAQERLKRRGMG